MALDAATISSLDSSVSLICEAGTGYNNIDLVAARERNIAVTNIPDYSSEAVATVVMTAILNFSGSILQNVVETKSSMQGREVFRTEGYQRPLFELRGKRLGLIGGNGTIGKKVTAMAAPFGLDVVVTSRSGNVGPGQTNISMEELLKTSDFVSFHAPLNDATRGMMGKEQFELMKESAYFINTARGGVVKQAELISCLNSNTIAGAFLDVQGPPEPPEIDDPIYDCPNLFMSPHIGWQRTESRQRLINMVAENIEKFFDEGSDSINVVN